MNFKDMVQEDIKNIFLDPEVFGETHIVDGNEMTIIIDENELVEREQKVNKADKGDAG